MLPAEIDSLLDFVRQHKDEDTTTLLLQRNRYPDVDMNMAAQQIEGQRQASAKWPTLARCRLFLYPPRLNREQSSSETTANYKAGLLHDICGNTQQTLAIADLTGGMGIDSMAFATKLTQPTGVDYVECNPELCLLASHNAKALAIDNMHIHCGDSMEWLRKENRLFDLIFIDPARRNSQGRKVTAFEDCQPDIIENLELLTQHCHKLMVKASPMIDIDRAVEQLGNVGEVHVVAVDGECKELLFLYGTHTGESTICCINLSSNTTAAMPFRFSRSQEKTAQATYCTSAKRYLFEPHAALMKGAPFKLLSQHFNVAKLDKNTHLYTSDELVEAWPGRVFEILEEIKLDKRHIAKALPDGKAHVATRNYPVGAAQLQRQLAITEGGNLFVVATTIDGKRTGFLCQASR